MNHVKANTIVSLLAITLLSACSGTPKIKPDPAYAPAVPEAMKMSGRFNGGIYQHGFNMNLFEDPRAHRVGDIINIVLVERTQASKKAKTNLARTNEVTLLNPTIMGGAASAGSGTQAMGFDTEHAFDGNGSSSQSNSLSGNIAVTVMEVLPNGNMKVRGEKLLTLNQGSEHIRLSGIVRPIDVRSDNSVLSTQVANARISYGGTGALADANRNGWLSQFFMKVWPF